MNVFSRLWPVSACIFLPATCLSAPVCLSLHAGPPGKSLVYNKCDRAMVGIFEYHYFDGHHDLKHELVERKSDREISIVGTSLVELVDEEPQDSSK